MPDLNAVLTGSANPVKPVDLPLEAEDHCLVNGVRLVRFIFTMRPE
jgi:hypothetical protein